MVDSITPEMARAELERRKQTAPAQNKATTAPKQGNITPEMAREELARRKGVKAPAQPPDAHNEDGGVTGRMRVISGGLVEGIPVAGPLIKSASDRIIAATQAGPMDWLSGATADDLSYEDALQAIQNRTDELKGLHPVLDTGSQIAGSVLSTMGAAAPSVVGGKAASIGAKALGLTGGSVAQRTGSAAITGAGLSAADTAARGGEIDDMAQNAVIGGVVSGAVPIVGAGLRAGGSAIKKLATSTTRPKKEAVNRVAAAMGEDAASNSTLAADDIASARTNGQNLTVADVGGENTRALARSAANISPSARDAMSELGDRFSTQHERATSFVSSLVNGKTDDLAFQDALRDGARKLNKPQYQKAYSSDAAQSLWDDEFAQLMQSPAVKKAAKRATTRSANQAALTAGAKATQNPFVFAKDGSVSLKPDVTPTLEFWDNLKRGLDDMHSLASRKGNKSHASDIDSLRKAVIGKLDKVVPEFAQARAGAASAFGAQDALDAGKKAVTKRMQNAELKRSVEGMNTAEKKSFGIGYASELIDKIRSAGERTDVINSVFGNPEAKEKIGIVLGKKKLKQLEAFIRVENSMKMLQNAVGGNSTTARQLAEMGLGGTIGGLSTGDLTGAVVGAGVARGKHMLKDKLGKEIAKVLMSKDPAMLQKLITKAGKNKTVLARVTEVEKQIASFGIGAGVASSATVAEAKAEENTPSKPVIIKSSKDMDEATKRASRNPSEPQKAAGNYRKAHIDVQGLKITIENAKGSRRRGKSEGKKWSVKMPANYGYLKRKQGADGDGLDVYIGDRPESKRVFVVDQIDPKTGDFDEHKVMLGTNSKAEAAKIYKSGFSDGSGAARMGAMTFMNMATFKKWLDSANLNEPRGRLRPSK